MEGFCLIYRFCCLVFEREPKIIISKIWNNIDTSKINMEKRPKPGEDEDAILQMQEEFLREKIRNNDLRPSAQVTNLRESNKRPSTCESRKPSKYAKAKGLQGTNTTTRSGNVIEQVLEKNIDQTNEEPANETEQYDDDKVYFPKVLPSILGDIVEKNTDKVSDTHSWSMPSQGFPAVSTLNFNTQRNRHKLISSGNSNNNVIPSSSQMDIDVTPSDKPKPSSLNLPKKSFILSCNEAEQIHQDNVEKLTSMSETEILDEQQKLLSNLDPKLVEFLKSRRSITDNQTKPQSIEVKSSIVKMDTSESSANNPQQDSLWENDVLSHPNVNQWLHFDSLEKDKLEWMKGIEQSKSNPDVPFEARFDFKGYLLPYTINYTEETKSLFHHGEEPHRPGYSLTELFELTRSAITQQRVMALNTIAGVLEYYIAGTFKDIIEIPLSKIFFIIRIAMDENKTIVLEPALKAMRNLLVNRIDEACLDALIGFEEGTQQPCLENDKSEIAELDSQESELKDFHLAEIDIITAAIRTNIIQRLYYILDIVRPSFNCVQYSLQILTRLARDSNETSKKIIEAEHLIYVIISNFVPNTSINFIFDLKTVYNGKPVLAAIKFIRILSLQNPDIAETLLTKYNIMKTLSTYLCSGVDGTYGLRIQIEAFCIITNLLKNGVNTDNLSSLYPIIITTLYKHVQGTDIFTDSSIVSATHAAVAMQLVNQILKCNRQNKDEFKFKVYPLIKEGVQKWLGQLAISEKYTCAHLRVLCSALDCCTTIITIEGIQIKFFTNSIEKLVHSKSFGEILNQLILCSNLLSGIDNKHLHIITNLMSLNSNAIETGKIVLPILKPVCPLPFLASMFKVIELIDDSNICKLILNKLHPYLNKLSNETPSLIDHWFTRIETDFLFSVMKVTVKFKLFKDSDVIYRVASKLCYILRADKRIELQFLFDRIIFDKEWFTADRLFNLITLNDSAGVSKSLSSIENIKMCYSKVINIGYVDTGPNIILKDWKEPILPRDWIYLPILELYSRNQDADTKLKVYGEHARKLTELISKEKENIIKSSLEWIIFNELCFSDLINNISVTDRFCRILCVFLCDNSLFLEPYIKVLLSICVQILFKMGKTSFNFDKKLTGLHNFQDFYTQLLEQFQSVSYGDYTFAACVLVPLAQKHNVKWRKLLWSEYAGCLRALDCPESMLCYDLIEYLEPAETDQSLIKSYFNALSSNLLRPDTIAFKIASNHVNKFRSKN